jgi:cob(I)alamin adenosyltransferase
VKIYTKRGDDGSTGLLGGTRVTKADERVEAYGTVDEANALIGVARAAEPPSHVDATLERVQRDLFALGAELACPAEAVVSNRLPLLEASDIERLERAIDETEGRLPTQNSFLLPTGCPAAAALHQARTVCRRAERRVVAAAATHRFREELLTYLNRLGDLLYVLARECNRAAGVQETPWTGRP